MILSVLNDLMRAGWPALVEVDVDGWVARFSAGVTQRANSVLPVAAPRDLDEALTRGRVALAERGLPAVFQLGDSATSPARCWLRAGTSWVTDVHPEPHVSATCRPSRRAVAIAEMPDQGWLDLWWAVDGRGDADALAVAVKILDRRPRALCHDA